MRIVRQMVRADASRIAALQAELQPEGTETTAVNTPFTLVQGTEPELPEDLIEDLARILAEALVAEYRERERVRKSESGSESNHLRLVPPGETHR